MWWHRLTVKLDLPLVIAALGLMAISLLTLAANPDRTFFERQLIWIVIALILILGLPSLNLRAIFSYRWLVLGIYLFILFLLIVTYFLAPAINSSRSWLIIGPAQIQPSEFMKAALIILFSSFFAARHVAIARLGTIATSFIYFLVPAVFVLLQPDLGTTLVLFGIWFGYLIGSELPLRHLFISLAVMALAFFLAWHFALADYQKARVIGLFSPESDPLGINYNVLQSKIAIGSGGFFGKGFAQGSQVQFGFLPEAQTDFVFSAFTEEWGLLGGLILIAIFFYLVYRILVLGLRSPNNFARFVTLGTALMLLIHFIVNLGSASGFLPVVGIGLPLVSYGGSNLLTVAFLLGIIQSVAAPHFLIRGGAV